jgi:hypothetical protein
MCITREELLITFTKPEERQRARKHENKFCSVSYNNTRGQVKGKAENALNKEQEAEAEEWN